MIKNKKIVVVLPAYNAAETLSKTYSEIPLDMVDEVILVDDFSQDETVSVARSLGIKNIVLHDENRGYGANQKSCYNEALALKADIIIMLHPDYQYTPKLIQSMVFMIANDVYPVVFGSRILGKGAIKGGMPTYKYIANRILTLFQNILLSQKLSEYHTGFRAYSRECLENIDYQKLSDDFIFDNQMVAELFRHHYDIGELSCPTVYNEDSSSINFSRSVKYGFGVLWVSLQYGLFRKKS